MSDQYWTFGGGPAERIEDRAGEFTAGLHLYVRSTITNRLAEVDVVTGPNGHIPIFRLPRVWEWSSVTVSVDEMNDPYPLGQARELQARPATVLRLQDVIAAQAETITRQSQALHSQGEQIGTLMTQVAAESTNDQLPDAVDPDSPDLPEAVDPGTDETGAELPLPTDPNTSDDDTTSLPLPEGFSS